jgi:glycosyltransferase involved in cell wall biosynthesis
MRVLLVTSMVPDPDGVGAIPKLLAAQLQGLSARHEVTLLTTFGEDPGQAEAAERLAREGFDVHAADRRRSPRPGRRLRVRAELAAGWLRHPWPWRVVSGAGGLQPLLDRICATHRFDVVAVEDNPVAVLRLPPGVPRVMTEHEAVRAPATQWLRGGRLRERPQRLLRAADWRRWERFLPAVWSRYDLLQVFCQGDAEAVAGAAPALREKVRINPYGMVLPPPADPALALPELVLFTGTFAHLPNRDAAFWLAEEIMPAVRRRRPGAVLRIVGSAPPPEVRALAGEGVELVADAREMRPHLEQAAVVVAPVRSGGGMRMKVLEAIALGKPVVTTTLGAEGFSSLSPELPFLVGDDGAAIAAAIADLLEDGGRRRQLGNSARAFSERHHSPMKWAERLEAVYEEAIASKPL